MEIRTVETEEELQKAYHVRNTVFVHEQKVPPEEEIDDKEKDALHMVGFESGQPIAASRLRFVDIYGKLERICVLQAYRNRSYGANMIKAMEEVIQNNGYNKAKLNAQTHAVTFYERIGYKVVSGEFMDAGIPHVTMVKEL